MKNNNSVYDFAKAKKALFAAGATRLFVSVDYEGIITVCNGRLLMRMNQAEYDAIVRPVVCCDAGNFVFEKKGQARLSDNANITMRNVLTAAKEFSGDDELNMTSAGLLFSMKNRNADMLGFYNRNKQFSAFFDISLVSAFTPDQVIIRAKDALSPAAVCDSSGQLIGIICPIRPTTENQRAIAAYFATDTEPGTAGEDEDKKHVAELIDLQSRLAALNAENTALREQLAAATNPQPTPTPTAAPAARDMAAAAEEIVSGLSDIIDGLQIVVNGIKTDSLYNDFKSKED